MRKLLFLILVVGSFSAEAQVFNNEWIDYSKPYYKFKVSKTGLHRISQAALQAAGLSATPAEHFQLWRNGVQVPIYTSAATGTFSSSDYIEFWGEMNDGRPDRELYRRPEFHLNDKWSLISDTAVYFLTVNTTVAANRRLQTTSNNVAGTSLQPEPYFMHTAGRYFKDKINPGLAERIEENLYSSSYDMGEGWTSQDVTTTFSSGAFNYGTNTFSFTNLFPYNGGPAAKFKIGVSGNTVVNTRRYRVNINSDSVTGQTFTQMNYRLDSAAVNFTTLSSGTANVVVTNFTMCTNPPNCPGVDRMVIHMYELTYPRQFNFGGANNFEFTMPASAAGNYLQIAGFNYGSTAPVLYDLTNGKRYVADISSAPQVRVVLEPSATERKLVLVSQENSNATAVNALTLRNFINYGAAENRGNYLIISHPQLYGNGSGNPVEAYRQYRASVPGGSYNAKVYSSEELIEQFGFGIAKNPAGIRNFLRYARLTYSEKPGHVFIIGKGVNYVEQRRVEIENKPADLANIRQLNLVPAYGYPGSDVLFTAEPGSSIPQLAIGRLSVITPAEVALYLDKMKTYEQAQRTMSPRLADRNWMKNVVHIVGASDQGLDNLLFQYLEAHRQIIQDTLFGAHVSSFRKTTTQTGQQLNSADLTRLFTEGISLITYFGHSSAITLDFNLDDPENYNNPGKYPLFIGLGCNAGDFFRYNPVRFSQRETISEKYVLAQERGTIGFIASTHFGVVHILDQWNHRLYQRISRLDYGNTIGEIMRKTAVDVYNPNVDDFLSRSNVEQTELHGDPALTVNSHPRPDYIIEEPQVRVEPAFISVADPSFTIKVKMYNNGMAVNRQLVVETKRQVGSDPAFRVYRRDTIRGIRYADSIQFTVPIDAVADKGLNKFMITVDADNAVDEIYESNNSVTKEVMIFEDEARPVYPYNFSIINKQNIKVVASTADPLAKSKQYRMEMDTTELFNSPMKVVRDKISIGGAIEFDPGITFTDSTVYYWRVAVVPASGPIVNWNTSSFVYLPGTELGFNQSHFYQHSKSVTERMFIDSASRQWKYRDVSQNIFIRHGTWVTSTTQETGLTVAINFNDYMRNACAFQSVVFNVFDPVSMKAMQNSNSGSPSSGQYGSWPICLPTRNWNYEYRYTDSASRRKAKEFMQQHIPDGAYVVVRSFALDPNAFSTTQFPQVFADEWKTDQAIYGQGNTLYDYLKNAGLTSIDSFNRPRQFVLVYKKNDPSFTPRWFFTDSTTDNKTLSVDVMTRDSAGIIVSPVFGPAKEWKELRWRGSSPEANSADQPLISVLGIRSNGAVDTLIRQISLSQQNVSLSAISAAQYPQLKLHMHNSDAQHNTPYQLRYWRVTYVPLPEGAIAPNIFFSVKDTIAVAEPLDFKIAFKNVSDVAFDSLKVKMIVTDRNNVQHTIPSFKIKALPAGDTVHVRYPLDTRQYLGQNTVYVEVNADRDQPEQFYFNNMTSFAFNVRPDTLNPLLDVTFNNVHILNHDIVSAKPDIVIKLTDESKWLITDPSKVNVQVRYPSGALRTFQFNSDTLQFSAPPSTAGASNAATVLFRPAFTEDGTYELIVSGRDMSDNQAGAMQYRVFFQVINKAMISNLLNYPNPFTTSTAFVFTLTGSEVPQNFKIQILTVTGKVVREITKEELGPVRIGRNITEYKWDGTDQFGQKLGNGVYLYRVITSLNGQSLEKYRDKDDHTDKFFNKGYGKMYLMR